MRTVENLVQLQQNPSNIRNVCILAHVDHGKTTLADSLLASNGIIHPRSAGKVRFMDNRSDEQERGITMKCSAVTLHHTSGGQDYLVNLIDSPGHVDFCGEVSSAVRLCDGAIVLVDVVEGVCPQTKVVLQQVWKECIRPVLVLNKIDRLILERRLEPLDAYVHLTQVLEQVNAVIGELHINTVVGNTEEAEKKSNNNNSSPQTEQFDWSTGLEDVDDSKVYFSPDLGNVIFASSLDGWGFRISNFSAFLATKMGMKEVVLNKTLWGDYYIKSKQVFRGALANAKKPLFVKLVLDNLWKLYEVIAVQRDKEQVQKIAAGLGIRLLDRDARQSDPKVQLHAILGQWMPLSSTVLDTVCEMVPSPTQLPEERTKSLMSTALTRFESLPADTQALHADFQACSSAPEAPVIVCISKMFPFEAQNLPQKKERQMTDEEMIQMRDLVRKKYREKMAGDQTAAIEAAPEESNFMKVLEEEEDQQDETVFIAFARVFSGTLRRGQEIFVLGPKYNPEWLLQAEKPLDPANLPPDLHVTSTTVKDLYLLMGRDLEAVPSGAVPAGNLVGIGGLEGLVLKTATLSTSLSCPPFTDLHTSTTPILRVALQPTNAQDMPQLKKGVRLLNQADPCVQVIVQETGELVLVTAGEVHLERCLLDLRERFARIEIDVSPPIVPFRETIIHPPKMDKVNEIIEDSKPPEETCWDGEVALSPDHKCLLRIRAVPLPEPATALLAEKGPLLKALQDCSLSNLPQQTLAALSEVQTSLAAMLTEADWPEDTVSKVWSLGPRRCGPNLLINRVEDYPRPSIWELNSALPACDLASLDSAIETGFQLATLAGPMCEEPMMGVAFVLEHCSIQGTTGSLPDNMGACTGQVITAVKEGCRKAFQTQPQRLMAAMYSCDIQVTSEVLGRLYGVLGRRHGRVLHGDLLGGSQHSFSVTAVLPVVESFQLAPDIRKKTSGLAMPQLRFSHWEIIEEDPYWTPTTATEYSHFGDKADTPENRALRYVNLVRRRKGLRPLGEQIVAHGEKQRTLARKK